MCGIAGMLGWNGRAVDRPVLETMIGMLRHRGPDDKGIHVDRMVGLAHARLSIIDLAGGRQPMPNADQSLWITFNGEIFNYVELKKDLERDGHVFTTSSDTEVILHMYEREGEECVKYFNGQWAFAIWDARKQRLFLSRDRLGVRPLFYTAVDGRFAFASEMKAILALPDVKRELDVHALDQIFTFWCPLTPRTIFKGIWELPPGHSMTVSAGTMDIRRYWHLEFQPCPGVMADADYANGLRELLEDATRVRLRADVPVGAYLSGGLDSSVVTALAQQTAAENLKTFSISFPDPEFDETQFQHQAVAFLKTDHARISCSDDDIAQVFPRVVWHAEQPILRTAPAPLYLLAQLVQKHGYKVVLTGEGSDELFGGYDLFKEAKVRRYLASHPESKGRRLLLKKLYPYLGSVQAQSSAYLQAFFGNTHGADDPFFSHRPRWDVTSKMKVFFADSLKAELHAYDAIEELRERLPQAFGHWDALSQAQYLEATGLLPGYILSSQGDRMAMAHSVEGRFPFLDHRVVEFAARIPSRLKLRALKEKYVLKQAAAGLVPATIRRRPKQPYRAPDFSALVGRQSTGTPGYVEELLSSRSIREHGLFDAALVEKLLQKAKRGYAIGMKDNMALLGILSTQLVADMFIKNFPGGALHASN
jgi:asparagine synthase (glutamine-hydrolysing)